MTQQHEDYYSNDEAGAAHAERMRGEAAGEDDYQPDPDPVSDRETPEQRIAARIAWAHVVGVDPWLPPTPDSEVPF